MGAVPQCAVVIPTYNGAHLLDTCLEALFAQPPERCELKVIVVDDCSSDDTVERFSSYEERVEVVARRRNGGFAEACNEGARAAGEVDHLVFLNNDTVPFPGWLDALVDAARSHPEAGIFGSKLLFPDGTVQHAGITIGQDRWPHHIYAGFPGDHPAVGKSRPMAAVTAACFLVRRELFERAGGFDTAFHNGYEDVDLCLRLGEMGHESRYCAESVLYHLESVTRWEDSSMRHTSHSDRVFAERWGAKVVPDDFDYYLADGLVAVQYGDAYPVGVEVSPLLATITRETGPHDQVERILAVRAAEVQSLRSRLIRATLQGQREQLASRPAPPPRYRSGGRPTVVSRGEVHRLGSGEGPRRVSVLMPVMDAGDALRRIMPRLLSQDANVALDVVAVDSASSDDTVDVLREFRATVLTIDPAQFDHGRTRQMLAEQAQGEILVFLNQGSMPCDDRWLGPLVEALGEDPNIAGASSRVLPYPDADPLTRRDGELDPSGSPERAVKRVEDWAAWEAMPVEERRLLINFHTVSAAIRASALRRVPFRSVRAIGEDILWAREILELGMALVHEAESRVFHSHRYTLRERLMRNVDDGIANEEISGRAISLEDADHLVRGLIAADRDYLRDVAGMSGEELDGWLAESALRRAAQVGGQWLGANHAAFPPQVAQAFSRVENSRRTLR